MKKVLCLIIVVLFISGSIFAQDIQELRIGSSISGNLSPGINFIYSVRTARAGVLTVETTGNIDTILEAFNEQEQFITGDDDSGEGNNARIEIVVQANKTYYFLLYGYDNNETGSFRISASHRNIPNPSELRFGSSTNANMSRGQEFWYRVRTPNIGYITVRTAGDIDTYLEVYDDAYNFLMYDDDGAGEGLNALVEFIAEANKVYFIRLKGYDREVSGRTSISSSFEALPPDAGNTSIENAVTITPGVEQTFYFRSDSDVRWFLYEPTRTVTLTIFTSGNVDTVMYILDSEGELVAEDDDSGEDYNARIVQRLNAGTYYIIVIEYWGRLGPFSIHSQVR